MEQQTEPTAEHEARSWNDFREVKPGTPVKAKPVEREVSRAEKFREARPSKKLVVVLMLATAILTMIIGFNWGGWSTSSSALQQVTTGSQSAVALRLAPICVAQSSADPDSALKLAEFKAITNSRDRTNYVKEQGWATMPGETAADNRIADACARLLMGN